MEAYLSPGLFADVQAGLDALRAYPLAILSNGSPKMLDAAVRANGLDTRFAHLISGGGKCCRIFRGAQYQPATADALKP